MPRPAPLSERRDAAPRHAGRWAALLLVLLGWFNCGSEELRQGRVPDIEHHPLLALSPPWWPLRAYVSRRGDEELYFEDSRLLLGERADLRYIASKKQGNVEDDLRQLTARVRPGEGVRLPYRDFPFEYPPLPLLAMVLPRLFAGDLASYRLAYGVLAAALAFGACGFGVGVCRTLGREGAPDPWRRSALLVLALGPIVVGRLDPLPAFLFAASLFLFTRGRLLAAGLVGGAAFLTKLYPLLIFVPWCAMLAGERRGRDLARFALGLVAGSALVAAPFLSYAPGEFLRSSFVYGARPFQIEGSVGALAVLVGGKRAIVGSFGSYNVTTPAWLGAIGAILLPAGVAACAWLAYRQAHASPPSSSEERASRTLGWSIAALSWVLVTSKVLSPQYMIWLLPCGVLAPGTRRCRLTFAAAGLTQLFYPALYDHFAEDGSRLVALLVVLRNAALVALAVVSLRAASAASSAAPPVSPT